MLNQKVIVLTDKFSEHYDDYYQFIEPFLSHYGLCFEQQDVNEEFSSLFCLDCALLVIGHEGVSIENQILKDAIISAVQAKTGIINFDKYNSYISIGHSVRDRSVNCLDNGIMKVSRQYHYITSGHLGEEVTCNQYIVDCFKDDLCSYQMDEIDQVLLTINNYPVVVTGNYKKTKIVQWGNYKWLSTSAHGLMFLFDDLLWKSFVWVARKPFAMRCIENVATLRVDDCCGAYGYYEEEPFRWVEIANKAKFKPWIGFFYEQMKDESIQKLCQLINADSATAQFHGMYLFGKVYKKDSEDSISNIVKKWKIQHGFNAKFSCYFIPHAYDLTEEVAHALDDLEVKIIGMPYKLNCGGAAVKETNEWLQQGPFRKYATGVDSLPWYGATDGESFYYCGMLSIGNEKEKLFNVLTEIRDICGYEWFNVKEKKDKYNNVDEAIRRGTEIFTKCYNGKILGNLFTHENSWRGMFISNIKPDNFEKMLMGIRSNIARNNPSYVSLDEAVLQAKALYNSSFDCITYQEEQNELECKLSGNAESITKLQIFYEEDDQHIIESIIEVPAFQKEEIITYKLEKPEKVVSYNIYKDEYPIEVKYSEAYMNTGTEFFTTVDGEITAVRVYVENEMAGMCTVQIWDCDKEEVLVSIPNQELNAGEKGWHEFELTSPLCIIKEKRYIVAASMESKDLEKKYSYVSCPYGFYYPLESKYLKTVKGSGVCSNNQSMPTQGKNYSSYFRDVVFRPKW